MSIRYLEIDGTAPIYRGLLEHLAGGNEKSCSFLASFCEFFGIYVKLKC